MKSNLQGSQAKVYSNGEEVGTLESINTSGATTSRVSTASPNEANTPKSEPTKSQQAKMQKAEKDYWKGMITRAEAVQMVNGAVEEEREKLRGMFILVKSVYEAIVAKGIATEEELTEFGRSVAEKLYGKPAQEVPEDTKDEDDQQTGR